MLDIKKYRTIPMAIQYFRGGYGRVELAPMMACIIIAIIPVPVLVMVSAGRTTQALTSRRAAKKEAEHD